MKRNISITLGILLIAAMVLVACSYPSRKHITVVFRYDDISEISDTVLETKIISAFHSNGMAFTTAVIPFVFNGYQGDPSLDQADAENIPLGSEKFDLLNSAVQDGIVEVSMHGYSHQTIPAEGGHREFEGLDYASQYKKISTGVEYLNERLDIPVNTFVPPWNRYDTNTLKALDKLGFTVLSANQSGVHAGDSSLLFLPSTCELNELQNTVINARKGVDPRPIIVTLFHQFDILGNDVNIPLMDFAEFSSLLEWLKVQDDVEVLTLQQALAQNPGLNAHRYQYNHAILNSKMIPPMLMGLINPLIYQSPYPLLAIISLFYLGILLISGLIVFLIGKSIFGISNELIWMGRIAVTIFLIFVVMYAFRGSKVGFRGATGVAIFIGATIGIWWSSLQITKKHQEQLESS